MNLWNRLLKTLEVDVSIAEVRLANCGVPLTCTICGMTFENEKQQKSMINKYMESGNH